jgi:hypothetical protein
VSIYLPFLWGSRPQKTLVCYSGKADTKKGGLTFPFGKPQTPYSSGPGNFPVPAELIFVRSGQRVPLIYFEEAKDGVVTAFKGTIRKFVKVSAVHL